VIGCIKKIYQTTIFIYNFMNQQDKFVNQGNGSYHLLCICEETQINCTSQQSSGDHLFHLWPVEASLVQVERSRSLVQTHN